MCTCVCICAFVLDTHQTHTRLSPKDTSEATYYALIRIMPIRECTVCRRMSHWLVVTDWSPTQWAEINRASFFLLVVLVRQDPKNSRGLRDFTNSVLHLQLFKQSVIKFCFISNLDDED